jgi:hypothetical protein
MGADLDESAVRKWLQDHPDSALKIVSEWDVPSKNHHTEDYRGSFRNSTDISNSEGVFKKPKYDFPDPSEYFIEISRVLHGTLDLENIMPNVLSLAAQGINAEKCSIYLFEKDNSDLLATVWQSRHVDDGPTFALRNVSTIRQSADGFIESLQQEVADEKNRIAFEKLKLRLHLGKGIVGIVAETQQGLNIRNPETGGTNISMKKQQYSLIRRPIH